MAKVHSPVTPLLASWHAVLGLLASHSKWYAGQIAAMLTAGSVSVSQSVPAGELCCPAQSVLQAQVTILRWDRKVHLQA